MISWLTTDIKTLITAGIFGSIFRIMTNPDRQWKRCLAQALMGVSAAVFIGPIFAHVIVIAVGKEGYIPALLAAGFFIGSAAEKVTEKLQSKFFDS